MRTRTFLVTGVLATLLVAGVVSYYASSHPDGLSAVAQTQGFADQAEQSSTAQGPFAGYRTRGVENVRFSGGLAGVAGSLVVLAVAGGLFWALRRRHPVEDPAESSEV